MIMPAKKTPAPQEQENTPVQEHKASAVAAFLAEKGRNLDTRGRRRWLPTVGRVGVRLLKSAIADALGQKEYTYQKGEGYPRVRILGSGVIIVPLKELYGSTKARENLEAMRKRMQAMYEEYGMEEVKRPASKAPKAASAPKTPAAKKRKRATPEKPVD